MKWLASLWSLLSNRSSRSSFREGEISRRFFEKSCGIALCATRPSASIWSDAAAKPGNASPAERPAAHLKLDHQRSRASEMAVICILAVRGAGFVRMHPGRPGAITSAPKTRLNLLRFIFEKQDGALRLAAHRLKEDRLRGQQRGHGRRRYHGPGGGPPRGVLAATGIEGAASICPITRACDPPPQKTVASLTTAKHAPKAKALQATHIVKCVYIAKA